ncbi:hypothetical protein R1sor_006953 [Riccia sorocarpa]|uniref:Lipase n=1 Tax=Riccia sorocarpa TaxID=122646 RepID=A0ABD3HP04_9MARC
MALLTQWYIAVAVLAVSFVTQEAFVPTVHAADSSFCGIVPQQLFCTEHRVHSPDGFELVLHRLSHGTATDSGATPVLIMHSEFLNADSWFELTSPADELLPLLLVNSGLDVWVGHERATYWSHGHLSLETNDTRFWDWTWDDQAQNDVPTYLDYINNTTGSAVHYIGLSQSATAGAAAATILRTSPMIKSLTLIGPTIYTGNTTSVILATWAFLFGDLIDQGNYDNGYQNGAFNFTTAFPGITSINGQSPVAAALQIISGLRTNTWSRFAYRTADRNNQAYGVPVAPNYHPEDIPTNIPVLVVYGGNDAVAPKAGVHLLLSRLRNVQTVFLPGYAHYDLLWSSRRTQDIFLPVLQFLQRHG